MFAFETHVHMSGTDPVADAALALDAMRSHEVIRMTPATTPTKLRAYYDEFVEAVGTPVDIAEDYAQGGAPTGERWSEIRYVEEIPDMAAFRHSKNAQPLHTDESYVSSPAGIMLFYCEHTAPSGGETVFVHGPALVDHLRANSPDLLDELLTRNVVYEKAGDFKDRPIIIVGPDGDIDFNFNYYCADANQSPEALALNQSFFDALAELPDDLVHPVGLEPGESVAWRDDRVLHGRNAFQASATDDRLIFKTGIVLPPD
jgi:alpha-ketoglutarate-dependent taurine dioxygenase